MALRMRRTTRTAIRCYVGEVPGLPGAKRLRRLVELAEPAESPMETRLRWLLLRARLPRPQVQVDLQDAQRRFVGRADLYYSSARLVIEFDGTNHRERLVSDDRRQNLLVNAGYQILRFTASDIYQNAPLVEAQVRNAIGAGRRVA
jgi:very-short-patch-repair endonuclease